MLLKQLTRTKTLIAILGLFALSACGDKGAQNMGPGAGAQRKPQVSVVEVTPSNETLITTLQGRTAPYMVAEVRPQVGGILQKRLFDEGAEVKEGQALYQIDKSLYEAQRASAEAEVARAESVLYQARLTANRYSKLVKNDAVSKQQNDDAQAAVKQANAALAAAKAQLKAAEINLDYTLIRSPIDGKAGRSLVTPGALLTAYQANNMVVVQTLDPIYVDVNQASGDVLRLKKDIAEGKVKANDGAIPINLILEDGTKYKYPGTLTLSEVSVDEGTGTITLRAEFPNPDHTLLPGMFVRAELPQGVKENALKVPQRALLRRADGAPYVLTVENGTVTQKPVVAKDTSGPDWIVEEGLKPGDKVVIEGFQRIRPGVPVDIVPPLSKLPEQKK